MSMAKDPVCAVKVDEKMELKSEYKGKIYYFCCAPCKDAFEKGPEKYVKCEGGVYFRG